MKMRCYDVRQGSGEKANLRARETSRGSEEEHNGRLHPPKSKSRTETAKVDVMGVVWSHKVKKKKKSWHCAVCRSPRFRPKTEKTKLATVETSREHDSR